MKNIEIISYGKYLPKNIVSNSQLEKKLNLEDGFIKKRTGIIEIYFMLVRLANYSILVRIFPAEFLSSLVTTIAFIFFEYS